MPRTTPRPEYGNQQIKELIMEYVHDKTDRKMLYWRLVDGETIKPDTWYTVENGEWKEVTE